MKKYMIIKQTSMQADSHQILYDGIVDVIKQKDELCFSFIEKGSGAKVVMKAGINQFDIKRNHSFDTLIHLELNQQSEGYIDSDMGRLPLSFFMRKYHYHNNIIALEYDILIEDEVQETIRIICKIREVMA